MSRLKKFAHSLVSGYVLLGANVVFSLASIPLAFQYLSPAEFGLWATTTQLAGYIALIDFGMSGVSRVLIDHKDHKETGEYGGLIQTTLLVSAVQGLIILVCGISISLVLGVALGVPDSVAYEFKVLLIGQSGLLAGAFLTRLFTYLLAAHQRYDISNYALSFSFVGNFVALWLAFRSGLGVYSMLWGQLAGWCLSTLLSVFWCVHLRLFPPAFCWGRPSWVRFLELLSYGRDIFLFMLGAQMVAASQTILIARTLGLEAAAVWSVCTRTFTLVQQLVYRLFDFSCAALAEMIVRQETERLFRRFRSIVAMSGSLSVLASMLFAVCNQSFVEVWSQGRIGWPVVNDVLLALWLVICVYVHAHTGLVGQLKDFRALRYLFFLEGLFFMAVSFLLLPKGGVTAMLVVSLLASLLFTFPYGIWRTSLHFGISWKTVLCDWSRPTLRLAVALTPLGIVGWWLVRPYPPLMRFLACSGLLSLTGLLILFRYGVEQSIQLEIVNRCPGWLRPGMRLLTGRESPGDGRG